MLQARQQITWKRTVSSSKSTTQTLLLSLLPFSWSLIQIINLHLISSCVWIFSSLDKYSKLLDSFSGLSLHSLYTREAHGATQLFQNYSYSPLTLSSFTYQDWRSSSTLFMSTDQHCSNQKLHLSFWCAQSTVFSFCLFGTTRSWLPILKVKKLNCNYNTAGRKNVFILKIKARWKLVVTCFFPKLYLEI